jgi:putative ABC transport system permease protein
MLGLAHETSAIQNIAIPAAPGGALALDSLSLSLSAGLVLIAGLVSVVLGLRQEKQLFIASARTVVQLLIVGFVLKEIFAINQWWAIAGVAMVMIAAASRAAAKRPSRKFAGMGWLAFITLIITSLLTTYMVTAVIIGVPVWYEARYWIPLLGMVLGNGLTGISLCLDALLEALSARRREVEMELAHGATRWEAARQPIRDAIKRGMIPIINSMMVVGIVSLPGMMTGQILAGADPLQAVKYQIVVMFMVAAATAMGCMIMALLVFKKMFSVNHQLLWQQIHKRET